MHHLGRVDGPGRRLKVMLIMAWRKHLPIHGERLPS
jgi:hypothetical protein